MADGSKNTIDEFIFTDWINLDNIDKFDQKLFESLNLKNLSFTNLYTFYNDILEKIIQYNVSKICRIGSKIDVDKMKDIYDKIHIINNSIEFIKGKMNKETQFNRNVEMNIQIKNLEEKGKN